MRAMRMMGLAGLLAAGLVLPATPVFAQDSGQSPTEKLEESVETFLSAIQLFLLAIPQYAAPEVLPNGDIIIRRIQPGEEQDQNPTDPPDSRKI